MIKESRRLYDKFLFDALGRKARQYPRTYNHSRVTSIEKTDRTSNSDLDHLRLPPISKNKDGNIFKLDLMTLENQRRSLERREKETLRSSTE